MLTRTQVEEEISGLYLTTIGRAADSAGVAYWTNQVMTGQMNVAEVGQSFFDQPEVQEKYDGLDTTAFVSAVYENVLGRTADTDGLTYWVDQLNSGAFSQDRFIEAINNGATGDDATRLDNMKIVGFDYMKKVGDNIDLASSVLDLITADPQSKADALALIDYYNANKANITNTDATSVAQWKNDADFSTFEEQYTAMGPDSISIDSLNNDSEIIAQTQTMYANYNTPEEASETTDYQETQSTQPVPAAFEFTTEWLNGKALYETEEYLQDGNIAKEEGTFSFSNTSFHAVDNLSDKSGNYSYNIEDGGIIHFIDPEEGDSYIKATEVIYNVNGQIEALRIKWSDTLEQATIVNSTSNDTDIDYFLMNASDISRYEDMMTTALLDFQTDQSVQVTGITEDIPDFIH